MTPVAAQPRADDAPASSTTAREDETVGAFTPFALPGRRDAWVPITCPEYDQLRVRHALELALGVAPAREHGDRTLVVLTRGSRPVLATVRVPAGGRRRCHHLHYDPTAVSA